MACVLLAAAAFACGDEDSDSEAPDGGGGTADGGGVDAAAQTGAGDLVTEAVLAKCPAATTLIQTTDWPSCLAGKRLVGVEPFSNKPCELRVGDDGDFSYLIDGEVAITVPERSQWGTATGYYQNDASVGPRIFLASVSPQYSYAAAKAQVTSVDISIFRLAGQTDKVEVEYLDETQNRQTYNCTLGEI